MARTSLSPPDTWSGREAAADGATTGKATGPVSAGPPLCRRSHTMACISCNNLYDASCLCSMRRFRCSVFISTIPKACATSWITCRRAGSSSKSCHTRDADGCAACNRVGMETVDLPRRRDDGRAESSPAEVLLGRPRVVRLVRGILQQSICIDYLVLPECVISDSFTIFRQLHDLSIV